MIRKIQRMIEKIKIKKQKIKIPGKVDWSIDYANDHVNIIHDACRLCYNSVKKNTYDEKLNYIAKRIKDGHESILEHSNIVTYYQLDKMAIEDLSKILPVCKFLNTKVKFINEQIHFLIGGSIRGYKEIFRRITDQDNTIAKHIISCLYNVDKRYFNDFIQAGIMEENKFTNYRIYNTEKFNEFVDNAGKLTEDEYSKYADQYIEEDYRNTISTNNEYFDIVNYDKIEDIPDYIKSIFSTDELLDILTVTIHFKDISRIISQMYMRHRNGVTQESQRYVDYSTAKFNSPELFKDKYKGKYYNIRSDKFVNGIQAFTMQELGEFILSIYPQLREQEVDKEDARGFLPNNTTTQFDMTFTYRTLIYFLYLREDKASQAEINQTAIKLGDIFRKYIIKEDDIYKYISPEFIKKYNESNYNSIDEIVEETIEEI